MSATGGAAGVLVVLTVVAGRLGLVQLRGQRVAGRLPFTAAQARAPRSMLEPPGWVLTALSDAAVPVGSGALWTGWCAMGGVVVLLAVVQGGPGLAIVCASAWAVGPALALASRRGAAGRAVEAGLPDVLEALARSLRSGAGTHQSLTMVAAPAPGQLGVELRAVVRDVAGGAGLEAALGALEARRPHPGVRLAVAALLLGADAGGAHARALDGVAASIRARLGVSKEVRALAAQARLSAVVIAGAPVGFAALAAGTDGASATFLLRTPLGLGCLASGLALDALGAWWMHRLAQVDR